MCPVAVWKAFSGSKVSSNSQGDSSFGIACLAVLKRKPWLQTRQCILWPSFVFFFILMAKENACLGKAFPSSVSWGYWRPFVRDRKWGLQSPRSNGGLLAFRPLIGHHYTEEDERKPHQQMKEGNNCPPIQDGTISACLSLCADMFFFFFHLLLVRTLPFIHCGREDETKRSLLSSRQEWKRTFIGFIIFFFHNGSPFSLLFFFLDVQSTTKHWALN